MRRTPMIFALIILAAVVSVAAVYAVGATQTAGPAVAEAPATFAMELPLQNQQVATTASSEHGQAKGVGFLYAGQSQDISLACTWYDIDCGNGTTDECCGSESSCLSYCGEVCGKRCIVAN